MHDREGIWTRRIAQSLLGVTLLCGCASLAAYAQYNTSQQFHRSGGRQGRSNSRSQSSMSGGTIDDSSGFASLYAGLDLMGQQQLQRIFAENKNRIYPNEEDPVRIDPAPWNYPSSAPGGIDAYHYADYTHDHLAEGSVTDTRQEKARILYAYDQMQRRRGMVMRRNMTGDSSGSMSGFGSSVRARTGRSPIASHPQNPDEHTGYLDTPLIPGQKWHVHDSTRPRPRIIEPGTTSTQETPGYPPSDAIVLFDGTNLDHWTDGGKPAAWKIENGYMEVSPNTGSISTKDLIGDCQLHIEWTAPMPPKGTSQGRGNSGVLFFGRYEIQVLDSYDNVTYADGQAAALYGSYPPLVNAMRKPGEWNVYDITFTVPRFDGDKLTKPGYFTVFHNGVCVQNHVELLGNSNHRAAPNYQPHPPTGSLVLQNHGNPVRYRNVWYRELKEHD